MYIYIYIYIYQSIYLSIDAWGARWDRHCAIGYGGVVLIGATTLRLGMWRNEQNSKRSSAPYIYLYISKRSSATSRQHRCQAAIRSAFVTKRSSAPCIVHKRSSALNAPYNDLIAA